MLCRVFLSGVSNVAVQKGVNSINRSQELSGEGALDLLSIRVRTGCREDGF